MVGLSAEQLLWYKFILSYFSIQIKIILLSVELIFWGREEKSATTLGLEEWEKSEQKT